MGGEVALWGVERFIVSIAQGAGDWEHAEGGNVGLRVFREPYTSHPNSWADLGAAGQGTVALTPSWKQRLPKGGRILGELGSWKGSLASLDPASWAPGTAPPAAADRKQGCVRPKRRTLQSRRGSGGLDTKGGARRRRVG